MDIEQIKKDFQELCTLTENFMKKYLTVCIILLTLS